MTQRGLSNAGTVGDTPVSVRWSPWRAVVGFGLVSLAADMVYEGARSITGPLLGSLGATAVCVPALAITPFLAGAGLAVACLLILAERAGKAVRSPAKTALLAHAAGAVGLGRGFAVHKALDQAGAVAGPLMVAAVAAVAGTLWPALAVLIVPGVAALFVLAWIRRRMPDPAVSENASAQPASTTAREVPRPRWRWRSAS